MVTAISHFFAANKSIFPNPTAKFDITFTVLGSLLIVSSSIENAIGSFEGVARTLRIALEEKIGAKVAASDPMLPWLIRHAGHIITRCWGRPSGKRAYQMIKDRRSNVHLKEFGEAVFFRIPETKNLPGKFEPRWEEGSLFRIQHQDRRGPRVDGPRSL